MNCKISTVKHLFLFAIVFFLGSNVFAQSISTKDSKVTFTVSNMGKVVEGTILNVKGAVKFDANDLANSSFSATVDPNTINTNSKGRDKHLRKDDFFGVANFSEIKMESKEILKTDKGYSAVATLTIRDISMDVTIPFTVKEEEGQQVLDGTLTVQRKDYKLGEKMDAKSIGFEVAVQIHCVITK